MTCWSLLAAGKFTAADVFDHTAAMAVLRARALVELQKVDVLLVPTALAHYTIQVGHLLPCM